ncbi:DUF1553 domain-containing protein [Thalassoglobus neptunius]|nr:DUF1553 domain-containing protein [Thalassoglobus neptunius]
MNRTNARGLQATAVEKASTFHGSRSIESQPAKIRSGTFFLCVTLILAGLHVASAGEVDFKEDVQPILAMRCVECHNDQISEGGLNLASNQFQVDGSDSGAVVVPQSADDSYLLDRVISGEMPPPSRGQSQKLPDAEIAVIRDWIQQGANWPDDVVIDPFATTNKVRAGRDWWALQPVSKPDIPEVESNDKHINPIDAFVLDRLAENGLTPTPRASKRVLLRRLYYDVIGLPPTEEQLQQFETDESPDAWEKQVDSLLASPHYGERWGRYWLDLARFAETSGYERDQVKPYAWKYRDWVVNALNEDMAYSEFIRHQLAGDEIESPTEDSAIATGFLRLGTWNDEPNDPLDYQYDRLEDLVHTTSSALLGLTVKCARCHNHKFDPILQEDYYRMASVFWGGPIAARDRKLLGGPSADELGYAKVLGWTDLTSAPEPIFLLKNGERESPQQEVTPATISSIPSLERKLQSPSPEAKTSQRRLQLAEWIADPKNPLTPRVLVNRIWQHHFGKAIVRTPNNFGFLSDPPTHPRLLDWLASTFLENGGHQKPIHKLILMSETWCQGSIHPKQESYSDIDAANRLWWRAERRRLDAEAMRDSMLAVTGELDFKIGGESFRETVSQEALEGLSQKDAAWNPSPVNEQKRRSLYMFVKRGLLPPTMTAFDMCDATQSCAQRDLTTVPTQALALMNNPFVHDRSLHLAQSLSNETQSVTEQIQRVWKAVLGRAPTADELELGRQHLAVQQTRFQDELERRQHPTEQQKHPLDQNIEPPVLHLRAEAAQLNSETQHVTKLLDLSGHGHDAIAASEAPIRQHIDPRSGRAVLKLDGREQFLKIADVPIDEPKFSIVCVVQDHGDSGLREIISNWNLSTNVGTSVFFGLADANRVRFSDHFIPAGTLQNQRELFILTAISGEHHVEVFQNGRSLGRRDSPLPPRKFDTPWVIGQQGNLSREYWTGGIAEVQVFSHALTDSSRMSLEAELAERYSIPLQPKTSEPEHATPDVLALASLCHVLLNSNEFIMVD